MTDQSIRSFLDKLEEVGDLVQIGREVDPDEDMSAIGFGTYLKSRQSSLFTAIKGHEGWRAASQICTDRKKWAIALGVDEADAIATILKRTSRTFPSVKVTDAPVHSNILLGGEVDLGLIPAMKISQKDPGRYIASGMCVIKDPETGIRNISFHRAQIMGRDRTGFLMLPRQAARILSTYRRLGRKMEVAMVIGAHPLIMLAGAVVAPFGVDEMTLAGGLLEEPIELVKCRTLDLEVPAHAEIVLEGTVDPEETVQEGPFGEVTGTYGHSESTQLFRIDAMTYRNDPIFYALHCGAPPSDTHSIVCTTVEMKIFQHLQATTGGISTLIDVCCPSSVSPMLVAIEAESRFPAQLKTLGLAALSSPYLHPKIAICCSAGTDIHDAGVILKELNRRLLDASQLTPIEHARVFSLDQATTSIAADGSRVGTKLVIDLTSSKAGSSQSADVGPDEARFLRWDRVLDVETSSPAIAVAKRIFSSSAKQKERFAEISIAAEASLNSLPPTKMGDWIGLIGNRPFLLNVDFIGGRLKARHVPVWVDELLTTQAEIDIKLVSGCHPAFRLIAALALTDAALNLSHAAGINSAAAVGLSGATIVPLAFQLLLRGRISGDDDIGITAEHLTKGQGYADLGVDEYDLTGELCLATEVIVARHMENVEGGLDLLDIHCDPAIGPTNIVVKMRGRIMGQTKTALMSAMSSPAYWVRSVILVDEDVDPREAKDVLWSLASRTDLHSDLLVIEDVPVVDANHFVQGNGWAPLTSAGMRWGVDTCMPPISMPKERLAFERALPHNFMR